MILTKITERKRISLPPAIAGNSDVTHSFCLPVQRGFSLIENLVVLVILSIGLLSIANMQGLAYQVGAHASMEATAVSLVGDMADRIRANPDGFENYIAANAGQNSSCVTTLGCSSSVMAAHDMWEWQQSLARSLPMGRGNICRTSLSKATGGSVVASPADMCAGSGERIFIWVQWDRNGDGVLDNPPEFRLDGDMYFYVSVEP